MAAMRLARLRKPVSDRIVGARYISLFVDSRAIDSYGVEDEGAAICHALVPGPTSRPDAAANKQLQLRRPRAETDAVSGILVAKELVQDGSRMRELLGHRSFRPSRLDNQLVHELGTLLRKGDATAWEAEDVVREHGAVLTPYHVTQVLKYCKDDVETAYAFFRWADLHEGFKHDHFSCNTMLKLLGEHKRYAEMKQLVAGMEEQMIPRTYVTYKMLVNLYVKDGMVEEALEAFHELEQCEVRPTVEDYKYFMHNLVTLGFPQIVPLVFASMQRNKVKPDLQAFNMAVNSCSKVGDMVAALRVFKWLRRSFPPDEYSYAAMINGYCKCSDTDKVLPLLEEMLRKGLQPNEAIYNVMMDAHYRVGKHDDVCNIFVRMKEQKVEPDAKSYRILLDSFEDSGKLDEARGFLGRFTSEFGSEASLQAYNTLMSKLGKAKKPLDALRVFQDVSSSPCLKPSVVTYNIAIDVLGKIGRLEDATEYFERMRKSGIPPDVFSYNTLMSSLGKAGKSEQCLKLAEQMNREGLQPDSYTFTSLVEALTRSGRLDMALEYLDTMKASGFVPNAATVEMLVDCLMKMGMFDTAQALSMQERAARRSPKVGSSAKKTPKLAAGWRADKVNHAPEARLTMQTTIV